MCSIYNTQSKTVASHAGPAQKEHQATELQADCSNYGRITRSSYVQKNVAGLMSKNPMDARRGPNAI